MLEAGVQTKNIISDKNPLEGFEILKRAGFTCCDFSLNAYLKNTSLYQFKVNSFFDKTEKELKEFFAPHREAAQITGVRIHQMHMPYPNYVPGAQEGMNDYLKNVVAVKSMEICAFFECPYIVIHGFKLAHYLGTEEAEWRETLAFIEFLAPIAKELGITVCIENLYTGIGNHIVEGPCCDAAKAAARIDEVNKKLGAEILGFCFDTGHANLVGLDFENFISTLGNRLKVLHIHDNDGINDLHQLPFTFTRSRENITSTDWKGFIKGLKQIDFDGVLSFETAPVLTAFPDVMKLDVLRFIANTGKYFAEVLDPKIPSKLYTYLSI